MTESWRPTATMDALRLRAAVVRTIRSFFADRGVLEVETPLLASAPATDPHLAAIPARYRGPGFDDGRQLWLQTSPEFAMKRLLAAGSGPIYSMGKAFRDGEAGSRHNPEFTMLEWYRPGWDHHLLMDEVEELLGAVLSNGDSDQDQGRRQHRALASAAGVSDTGVEPGSKNRRRVFQGPPQSPTGSSRSGREQTRRQESGTGTSDPEQIRHPRTDSKTPRPRALEPYHGERLTYAEVVQRHIGLDPHTATASELAAAATELLDHPPPDLGADRDGWLDLLLSHAIEPELGRNGPTFVYDYPASQAALARIRPGNPPIAERFEVWIEGVELANGYHELTDAGEQRRRFEADLAARRENDLPEVPIDGRLLAALEHGMPPCAGVALGIDRLVMLAAGADRIDQVIAFPVDRA
jgi:lysyl-tRNA synthetase class 2